MTDDLSPMLPQPSDDNAPMISGRGTKIIADARGAYLAGNLRALIERMDETQQLRFRQAIVQQGIWFAEELFPDISDLPFNRFREAVQQWLRKPTEENGFEVQAAVMAIQPFLGLTMLIAVSTTIPNLKALANSYPTELSDMITAEYKQRVAWGIRRWHVEAAWSILSGRSLPNFPNFHATDNYAAYWTGNLSVLIGALDAGQQQQLQQVIVPAVVENCVNIVPNDREYSTEQRCFQAIQVWVSEPNERHRESILEASKKLQPNPVTARDEKRILAQEATRIFAKSDLEVTVNQALRVFEMIAWVRRQDKITYRNHVHWWIVEVTWAILQATEIPPFPEIIE